jgi:1-deoxy-D-xylulose-5-phosphate reductoisomerase
LGATGSIGTSTLDLIERNPEGFRVVSLTAHSDVGGLADAARRTRAEFAAIADPNRAGELAEALAGTGIETAAGPDAIVAAAERDADWTMAAIVGCAGLHPVMAAVERGKTVALANKEALVSGGPVVLDAVARSGARLLPVDSEHNAIFQCYDHEDPSRIRKVILTASGGPFREWSCAQMAAATPAQAVKHPNWSMGAKISVDSATLMNKGLELIEAHHLFPIGADKFEVLVHPQSVIHSMVEYVDGSVIAQLGTPDMRTPIAHTLAWPERMGTPCPPLNLAQVGSLSFEAPDDERFPALKLAREALEEGGARPAVLNAANEIAVAAFLAGKIGFLEIAFIVGKVLDRYQPLSPASLEDVFEIDARAREEASRAMEAIAA